MASPKSRPVANSARSATAARGVAIQRDEMVIRFAGDAGEGIQLIASQFASASAACGNNLWTLPDPPAEIRAPAGTLAGVTGFQIHFAKGEIHTPGDRPDALLAMNPASLRIHLADLEAGGILIINSDAFLPEECTKAGYAANPIEDGSLARYRLIAVPMTRLNGEAVARVKLSSREIERSKSLFALGLACWLFDRPMEPIVAWIHDTYSKNPAMIEAAGRSLNAGYHYGESNPAFSPRFCVARAEIPAGRYRMINGIEAMALGILAASRQTGLSLVFSTFPQQPANELLHQLSQWKQPGVRIIQAEDDLAAINLALGASFGGALGIAATTGPGLALQSETIGLAVMSELPCVIIDLQRAGPSTGMPTKTEQSDLLLAMHGRNGESPLIVLAPQSPGDCFDAILDASRLAIHSMSPVIVLADTYLIQAAETWRVPNLEKLPRIEVVRPVPSDEKPFLPYQRDAYGARPWAVPGTPGLEHRTGGLEKEIKTGNVSYDAINHQVMVRERRSKIERSRDDFPPLQVFGPAEGELLVVGWGSTHGVIRTAIERCRRRSAIVAHAHFRHLNPLPKNTGDILCRYRKILVPEMNLGQFCQMLRAQTFELKTDLVSLNLSYPIAVHEMEEAILKLYFAEE